MTEASEIWTGEADIYNRTRPTPPLVLLDIFTQLIHTSHPDLVVDLGSGTGLSSAIWRDRARQVVGIEPNEDMRNRARENVEMHGYGGHVEYREGTADRTGLPDACADIVTCAQSLHWMEPVATLAEIARILRPGGLFAAYDYDWPPALHWELEQVYQEMDERFDALVQERKLAQDVERWSKEQHLERMRESGHFRFTRELLMHTIEQGDAARFIGMVLTNGYDHHLKQHSVREQEIGLDRLKDAALQYIGVEPMPWYFSYRARVGVK